MLLHNTQRNPHCGGGRHNIVKVYYQESIQHTNVHTHGQFRDIVGEPRLQKQTMGLLATGGLCQPLHHTHN